MKTLLDTDEIVFNQPELGCALCLTGLPGGNSRLHDISPYGNTGEITGATWVKTPGGLWCLSFDGIDDCVDCGNDESLNITGSIALELWIKTSTGGSKRVLSKMDAAGTKWAYDLQVDYFTVSANGTNTCERFVGTSPADSVWHHLVAVFVPSRSLDIYVDGKLCNGSLTGSIPASLQSNDAICYLGRRTGGDYFTGCLALPCIYNRALTALEIRNHFNRGKHMFGVWER